VSGRCRRRGGRPRWGRLRCAARSAGARPNSLRGPAGRCAQTSGRESGKRSALRAPPAALRCSPPRP